MSVIDQSGKTIISCPVGIGRGPLAGKVSMQDCITPVGEFVVDVVLSNQPEFNHIDKNLKAQLEKNSHFAPFVKDGSGLAKVFFTMNAQDFNRDGKPDSAYGTAFFGLHGKNTGPKLIASGNSARWYSIALHGSPDETRAIGNATSEGCIHISKAVLQRILSDRLIEVGTPVYIDDGVKRPFDVKIKSSGPDNRELVRVRN